MRIELHEIPIFEVVNGYADNAEEGVVGYGGRLNIRPAYQREFIYKDKQRDEVIRTIRKGFPLNVMYWVKSADGDFELMDGQQRTISLCSYAASQFALDYQFFHNLTAEEQKQFMEYSLMVYICEGTNREKLDWFKTINIAGEQLTAQELRNAVYTGPWLASAKKYFSKTGCPAYQIAGDYLNGSAIRQDYLETAIRWAVSREGLDCIETYMATHQQDENASQLWLGFQRVIQWVEAVFPKKRKEMKGIEWGPLYDCFKEAALDPDALESNVKALMMDDEVTNKKGIYTYLLTGEEKHLSLRAFTEAQKRAAYERQGGICPDCRAAGRAKVHYEFEEMQGDHITPWSKGGKTTPDNCKMRCAECNRRKSDR